MTRRRLLALTGAAGAGAVAGCIGSGGSEVATEYVDGVPDDYADSFRKVIPSGPEQPYNDEIVFNPFHINWNVGDPQEQICEYLTVYHYGNDEFVPRVAESWEHEDGVTRVELSDEYGWSDGTSITAEDFVTGYKLDVYTDAPISDFLDPEGIRADGDYAFELELREEYQDLGEELWYSQALEHLLNTPTSHFGEFVDRYDDASSEDEIDEITEDLLDYTPSWDEIPYSGPFAYVEANEQYGRQAPNPHHPIAQDWEFYHEIGMYYEEEGVRAEELTYHHGDSILEDLPDQYELAPVSYSAQTFALLYGPEDEFIANDRRVRQAIAYASNFELVKDRSAPPAPLDEYSAGIDIGYIEEFVEADVLDAMYNYAPHDTDTAQDLLEEVGFENDDGEWYTPDDERWELTFSVGEWFAEQSEVVANNLQEFGIDVDYYVSEMPTWEAEVEQPLEYDLSMHLNYGQSREYHAYSDLEQAFFGNERGAITEKGLLDETVEIPEPGDHDGEMQTVDIPETLETLAITDDEDEMIDLSTTLAWVHNYHLPGATIHPWAETYWIDADNWNFDLDSDAWLTSNRIVHYLLEEGLEPQ